MIDPALGEILSTAFLYGVGVSFVAGVIRLLNRKASGPSFSQSLAIGFLAGGTFGAIIGMFNSILNQP